MSEALKMARIVGAYSDYLKTYSLERSRKARGMPPALIKLETRLNRKIHTVTNRLINKLIRGEELTHDNYRQDIRVAYGQHIKKVAPLGRQDMVKSIQAKVTPRVIPELKLQNIIDSRTFRASDFTLQRLEGEVLPAIQRGILEGQTLEATAADLATQFNGLADWQMMRISRTETQSTYNQTKFETLNNANLPPGVSKTWLASGMESMRPSHEALNGETVPVEEPFSNGLMFPGDPDGPPEEIINCECTLIPNIRFNGG